MTRRSPLLALTCAALFPAAQAAAAPFLDDFSTDTFADYTGVNTYNTGGSFAIQDGGLIVDAGVNNTYNLFHNTARLEAGEYVAIDVTDSATRDIFLTVSTTNRQPAGVGSGLRVVVNRSGNNPVDVRLTNNEKETRNPVNETFSADALAQVRSIYIFRDTATQFRVAIDLGSGLEFVTLPSGPIDIAGTAEVSGLYVGVEVFNLSASDDATTFDNLRIGAIPEPASLMLMGMGGVILLRRTRNHA